MDRYPTCTGCGKHTPHLATVLRTSGATDECIDCVTSAVTWAEEHNESLSVVTPNDTKLIMNGGYVRR